MARLGDAPRRAGAVAALALLAALGAGAPGATPLRLREAGAGLPETGQWRQGFVLADVDGDGIVDLAHGPPRRAARRTPRIFRGDGAGGFHEASVDWPELVYEYGDAGVGDLDGDGRADLVLAMHLRGVLVLWGRGDDRFVAPGPGGGPSPIPFPSRALEVADLDGDGLPEVVALAEGPLPPSSRRREGVLVLRWGRDRSVSSRSLPPAAVGVAGDLLLVADLDEDGAPEVAVAPARRGAGVLVWPGAATGPAGPPVRLPAIDGGDTVTALSLVGGAGGAELVAAAVRPGGGSRVLAPGREPGGRSLLDVDGVVRSIVGLEDAGGGLPGIALLLEDGSLVVRERLAEASWGPPIRVPIADAGRGCGGVGVRSADLDGDGLSDLVAAFASEPDDRCPGGGHLRAWLQRPEGGDAEPSAGGRDRKTGDSELVAGDRPAGTQPGGGRDGRASTPFPRDRRR